jgi:hypothetical protein
MGGAGTHTGHTRDTHGTHWHTDHTDEPHNHPKPSQTTNDATYPVPTPCHTHDRTTTPTQQPQPRSRPLPAADSKTQFYRCSTLCPVCVPAPPVSFYRYSTFYILNSQYVPSRRGVARHACRYSRGSWQCAIGSELQYCSCRFCNCRGSILGTVVGCICSEQSGVCSGNL